MLQVNICSCIIVTCGMQVPGAEVKVYRVSDPVHGDNPDHFEEGVLDAPLVTDKVSSPWSCMHRYLPLLSLSGNVSQKQNQCV